MKRLLIVSFLVLSFVLLTAPTAVEYHPLLVNGKPWGNVAIVDGTSYFISLSDFSRAGGATLTLEEVGLTLTGSQLKISQAAFDAFHKHKEAINAAAVTGNNTLTPNTAPNPAAVKVEKKALGNAMWKWQRDGIITGGVARLGAPPTGAVNLGGGVYIPLGDLAKAFGGTFTAPAAKLQPGEALRLNFTRSPNAILIGL